MNVASLAAGRLLGLVAGLLGAAAYAVDMVRREAAA